MSKLQGQINMDVKKNNRKIARELTVEDIETTDLKRFFERIIEIAKENK